MKKQKFKTMYMHTLDGQPAMFSPLVYGKAGPAILMVTGRSKATLHKSLHEIRTQQNLDAKLTTDSPEYGYALVKVPA